MCRENRFQKKKRLNKYTTNDKPAGSTCSYCLPTQALRGDKSLPSYPAYVCESAQESEFSSGSKLELQTIQRSRTINSCIRKISGEVNFTHARANTLRSTVFTRKHILDVKTVGSTVDSGLNILINSIRT